MARRWNQFELDKVREAAKKKKENRTGYLRQVFNLWKNGLRHRSMKTLIRKIKASE